MTVHWLAYLPALLLVTVGLSPEVVHAGVGGAAASSTSSEWPSYGRNDAQERYTPLSSINPRTIGHLGLKWALELPNETNLVSTPLTNGLEVYPVDARTVMILDAWVTTNTGSAAANDLTITPISRSEYASFSNKASPGRPTSYWFDRLIAPTITLWPVPNNATFTLNYYRCIQMQDANLAGGETPDLPYLWLDWFIAGMSHRLARVYSTMEMEKQRKLDAMEAWTIAATQNTENVPMSLKPTISTYYRR